MAGADQLGLRRHRVQAVQHRRLEGPEDAVEVVLQLGLVVDPVLGVDAGVHHGGLAEVAAQEVAGEEGLVRRVPGEHGVRPVEQGGAEEGEGLAPQVQGVPVLYHPAGEVLVGDGGEKLLGRVGAEHRQVGAPLQQGPDTAGVVGLSVVHDEVVQLLQGKDLLDVVDQLVKIVLVDGLDEGGLLPALHQIRVIRGAVGGGHHDVEDPQGRVEDPHRPDVLPQLDRAHRSTSFPGRSPVFEKPSISVGIQYIFPSKPCQAIKKEKHAALVGPFGSILSKSGGGSRPALDARPRQGVQ